jgi:hypothetical protein
MKNNRQKALNLAGLAAISLLALAAVIIVESKK